MSLKETVGGVGTGWVRDHVLVPKTRVIDIFARVEGSVKEQPCGFFV